MSDGSEVQDPVPVRIPRARMVIAVLSLVGVFVALYLSMYKWGMTGALQCTIGGCEVVQNSPWSELFGRPVSEWGLAAYLFLLVVSLIGLQPRFLQARWVSLAIFATAAIGVAFSGYLTYLEAFVIEAWCQWCVISAILVTLIFFLSIPGLRRAR